jgi:hypothetical protein
LKHVILLLWQSVVIDICWLYEKNWKRDRSGKTVLDSNGSQIIKEETRSLFWFLDELKLDEKEEKETRSLFRSLAGLEFDEKEEKEAELNKIAEFDSRKKNKRNELLCLEKTVSKVRLIRNKWVAHRDREAFENPNKFLKDVGLKIEDIKVLVEKAISIIQIDIEIVDGTQGFGINKLFDLVTKLEQECPNFNNILTTYSFKGRKFGEL